MSNTAEKQVWTIGHSTRSEETFIALLRDFEIRQIADVRRLPGSRKFPQFNQGALRESLEKKDIRYTAIQQLGGRRQKTVKDDNTAWRNPSFGAYAKYMETEAFVNGLQRLKRLASKQSTAIMCAEAVWWRCHRALIADFLKSQHWSVTHIMAAGRSQEHPYTSPAKIINDQLTYRKTQKINNN